jgi:hypothetical protein
MTIGVTQSKTSKGVTTGVVATVLRAFVDIGAAINVLSRASNPVAVGGVGRAPR